MKLTEQGISLRRHASFSDAAQLISEILARKADEIAATESNGNWSLRASFRVNSVHCVYIICVCLILCKNDTIVSFEIIW